MRATEAAWTGLPLVGAVVLGLACWRMLRAGALEARGELEAARTRARAAGFLGGGAAIAASAGWLVGPTVPSVTAALLAAATGWTVLLAGLSGKPRPSGVLAALLWGATAVAGVIAATGC